MVGVQIVRNGQKVWPTCISCGCRLELFENNMFVTAQHFWGGSIKDARGCRCPQLTFEWSILKRNISHLGYC